MMSHSIYQQLRWRRPRLGGFVVAALLVAAATYLTVPGRGLPAGGGSTAASAPTAATAPTAPGAPVVLDAGDAPVESIASIDHSIAAWSKNLDANPRDFLAATNIAILYGGRGRLSYDLTDHERALEAARTALAIEPNHAPARIAEATTLVTLHDFAAAFAAAEAILRSDASQIGATAVRFDAALEMGRIEDARLDLETLRAVGGPAVLVRAARFASVTGDAAGALEWAIAARTEALDAEAPALSFYSYAVGEYARRAGDAARAREGFTAALADRPDDLGALVGLARIDAYEGRGDEAIERLRQATLIAPQPEPLGLLVDALRAKDPADPEAQQAADTIRFIGRLGDVQAATYDREILRFEVDHGGADTVALERIRAGLFERPDAAGHDLEAWALYRLGRYEEASASIAEARSLGADDARLRFHDGAIRVALGDREGGVALLRDALALGPALDPIERAEAEELLGGDAGAG